MGRGALRRGGRPHARRDAFPRRHLLRTGRIVLRGGRPCAGRDALRSGDGPVRRKLHGARRPGRAVRALDLARHLPARETRLSPARSGDTTGWVRVSSAINLRAPRKPRPRIGSQGHAVIVALAPLRSKVAQRARPASDMRGLRGQRGRWPLPGRESVGLPSLTLPTSDKLRSRLQNRLVLIYTPSRPARPAGRGAREPSTLNLAISPVELGAAINLGEASSFGAASGLGAHLLHHLLDDLSRPLRHAITPNRRPRSRLSPGRDARHHSSNPAPPSRALASPEGASMHPEGNTCTIQYSCRGVLEVARAPHLHPNAAHKKGAGRSLSNPSAPPTHPYNLTQ